MVMSNGIKLGGLGILVVAALAASACSSTSNGTGSGGSTSTSTTTSSGSTTTTGTAGTGGGTGTTSSTTGTSTSTSSTSGTGTGGGAACASPPTVTTGALSCPSGDCTLATGITGYEFAFGDPGPMTTHCLAPNNACIAGTLTASNPPSYTYYGAGIGINLGPAVGTSGPAPVQLGGTGIGITLSSLPTGARLQIERGGRTGAPRSPTARRSRRPPPR